MTTRRQWWGFCAAICAVSITLAARRADAQQSSAPTTTTPAPVPTPTPPSVPPPPPALPPVTTAPATTDTAEPVVTSPAPAPTPEPGPGAERGMPLGPAAAPSAEAEAKKLSIELHGGAYLWYYQPLEGPAKRDFSLYAAYLLFDAKYDDFGVLFQPRFRDTKLRPYYQSIFWVQEVYAYWKKDWAAVKVGKVYTRLGKFWDNSFYGNLQYFDGLKLSPDYGISLEASPLPKSGPFRLGAYAQYFVNDGVTNGSLLNRDTVSVPGARKRDELVGRIEPGYYVKDDTSVVVGLSGQYFDADLPAPYGGHNVYRFAADINVTIEGALSIYGEYTKQVGRSVTDYPVPGAPATATAPAKLGLASKHNDYVLAGAELTYGRVTGRFNFSYVNYDDVGIKESMYQPGVVVKVHENVALITEYANWNRFSNGLSKLDHSLNFVLHAKF